MAAQQVLIVADSKALRMALWNMLFEEGYIPHMTSSGLQALETLHTSRHRLVVILDVDAGAEEGGEGMAWLLEWITAHPTLASRHAYLALTAMPDHVSPDLTTWLTRLHAPLVAKPSDVGALLLLVAEASERLNGDGVLT